MKCLLYQKFELSGTNNDVEYFKERVRDCDHIELNNEITQMQDGFYQLHKDKEALEVFMEEARENTVHFNSVAERMGI